MGGWKRLGLGATLGVIAIVATVATIVLGLLGDLDAGPGGPGGHGSALGARAAASSTPEVSPPFVPDPDGPRFPVVTRTVAPLRGGASDLYVPSAQSAGRERERYPLALLVADDRTDPGQYEQLAHEIGGYGIAVVVTDRPASQVVLEVRAWARTIEADPSDYLHGSVGRAVSFVVLHGARRPEVLASDGVVAAVHLTPTQAVRPPRSSPPLLFMCGDRGLAAASCATTARQVPRVVVAGSEVLDVTDEGRRGARRSSVLSPERLPTIEEYGRTTALWLLAHDGDERAERYVARVVA